MYKIYIDDERTPIEKYDAICRTPDEAIKAFRKRYKAGGRHYFLEMDYDSGQPETFDKVLTTIESYVHLGKMKDLDIDVHIHSGNSVGREKMRSIIRANSYMSEVW